MESTPSIVQIIVNDTSESLKLPPSQQISWTYRYKLIIEITKGKVLTGDDISSTFRANFPQKTVFADFLTKKIKSSLTFTFNVIVKDPQTLLPIAEYQIKKGKKNLEALADKMITDFSSLRGLPTAEWRLSEDPNKIHDEFLNDLRFYINAEKIRVSSFELYEFLELSAKNMKTIRSPYKAGYAMKLTLTKASPFAFFTCKSSAFDNNWVKSWVQITPDAILFTDKIESEQVVDVLQFDSEFSLEFEDILVTKYLLINLKSAAREISFRVEDPVEAANWLIDIKEAYTKCDYTKVNRFMSSFPIRDGAKTKWFIGGEPYFADIQVEIAKATTDIVITDFWLAPEVHLHRPVLQGDNFNRLDQVLKRAADSGVQIYVILYMESIISSYQDTGRVRKVLEGIHPTNVHVIRHPGNLVNFSVWTHNQKMVVIDRKIAYMGGIDLCYGRCEDRNFDVTDKIWEKTFRTNQKFSHWPGLDYNNEITNTWRNLDNFNDALIPKASVPRLPWHDIGIKVEGQVAHDMFRHFLQYWNFVNHGTQVHPNLAPVEQLAEFQDKREIVRQKVETYLGKVPNTPAKLHSTDAKSLTLVEALIYEARIACQKDAEEPIELPKDKMKKQAMNDMVRPPTPSLDDHLRKTIFHYPSPNDYQPSNGRVQFCRSAGHWSLGLKQIENSIHNAYIELISNAKNFVLILNQYFVSSAADENVVHNCVSKAIICRIQRAAKDKENFKVVVILPLTLDNKALNGFMAKTINRGGNSILEVLAKDPNIKNPGDFITFFGLRSHGAFRNSQNPDLPATNQVYVHANTMIVDDEIALIGSANITDKSILGSRDSEIAMIIEDSDKVMTKFAGTTKKVSVFAHTLRENLYQMYFGLPLSDVQDPLDPEFIKKYEFIAKKNTEIFRKVFRCVPDDNVASLKEQEDFQRAKDLGLYNELVPEIRGFVVEYPHKYLINQELETKIVGTAADNDISWLAPKVYA
jgi:phospholipase D1/2